MICNAIILCYYYNGLTMDSLSDYNNKQLNFLNDLVSDSLGIALY